MKAKDALKILRVSRGTLTNYVKEGKIKVIKLPTGRYDYDEESVYSFLNKDVSRNTVIYARVSTPKQRKDLENQVDLLKNFCFQNGWKIHSIYQDVASGISFEKRKDFFQMLDEILANKVEKVVISYKDRISRVGFELFYHLFKKFGTEII
ncbi:MAG: Resolvase containing, partial [Candidatus Magnetoglobus multicellularis str. Araruama]